jgi:hypothetical protein
MAAVVPASDVAVGPRGGAKLVRYYGTGAANTDATLTTPAVEKHKSQRVVSVMVKYSASATEGGTTVVIDSGLGSGYDTTINTGSTNTQNNPYIPDGDVWLSPGDALQVNAPAGGSGVTAAIVVIVEES